MSISSYFPKFDHPRIFIAIGSKSGVGKDTLADILEKHLGGCKKISFSSGVYAITESIQKTLGVRKGEGEEEYKLKDRELLNFIGEGMKKFYGHDVWAKKVRKEILWTAAGTDKHIVVTDLRFKEEWEVIKEFGFKTIRLRRKTRKLPHDPNAKSETDLDDFENEFDFFIDNDGELDDLKKEALKVLKSLDENFSSCDVSDDDSSSFYSND